MRSLLTRITPLVAMSVLVMAASIYADWGSASWSWFQRSGALVVLFGAVLSYRSIVREGQSGVGGSFPMLMRGAIEETKVVDGQPFARVRYSPEDSLAMREARADQTAGYIGAILIVVGTLV